MWQKICRLTRAKIMKLGHDGVRSIRSFTLYGSINVVRSEASKTMLGRPNGNPALVANVPAVHTIFVNLSTFCTTQLIRCRHARIMRPRPAGLKSLKCPVGFFGCTGNIYVVDAYTTPPLSVHLYLSRNALLKEESPMPGKDVVDFKTEKHPILHP